MKMRSKRDRRPLLNDDVPILSDQMPLKSDEGDPPLGAINNQLNGQGKKTSWKRLFGKGGGAKGKQDENSLLTSDGRRDGSNIDHRPTEHSYSSSMVNPQNPEKLNQKHVQQERASTHSAIDTNTIRASRQSSAVSDNRYDAIAASKSISDAKVKDWDVSSKKNIPQPSSTKSQNSNRSNSRSRSFMRSLKKKSAQDLSSPSSAANISVASQRKKGDDQKNEINASRRPANACKKQSSVKDYSQQKRTSSTTPLSSAAMKDVGDSAKYDVKKILSKPFGREHILMTEQTVSSRKLLNGL